MLSTTIRTVIISGLLSKEAPSKDGETRTELLPALPAVRGRPSQAGGRSPVLPHPTGAW